MTFFDERGVQIPCKSWVEIYEPYYFLGEHKLGRKINARNQSSHFVEDEVCSLLAKAVPLSKNDLVQIMAWKLGLIDHSKSEKARTILCRQNWPATLTAKLQFRTLDFSVSLPTLAASMPAILNELRRNNPQYLFNMTPQLPGFGNVFILTVLFFVSQGMYPINDKYAHVAAIAIHEGLRPGSRVRYRGIQKWRDYEDYVKLLRSVSEVWPQDPGQPSVLISRPLDRALWVYGHFFETEGGGRVC
jgi:hypothetical protein